MGEYDFAVEYKFQIDWGLNALLRLLSSYSFQTVLDIGSGAGEHARLLRHFGKEVFTVDSDHPANFNGDFLDLPSDRKFDVVWCSHVLEHQRNVGQFLEKTFTSLNDDGILAISVPTHPQDRLVSGHITSWNSGLLCYNLILAGFDCSRAKVLQTSELSVIVEKRPAVGPEIGRISAHCPVEQITHYFPYHVEQGANADVREMNWGGIEYQLPTPMRPGTLKITSQEESLVVPLSKSA